MTTPSKAMESGLSVEQIIGRWDAAHGKRVAHADRGPAADMHTQDEPTPAADKVTCPTCGSQYSKRAKWVTTGATECFRCSTKKGNG